MLSVDAMCSVDAMGGPATKRLDADEMAVERLVAGRWNLQRDGQPRPDDVAAAFLLLTERGATARSIAARLCTSERQVSRWQAALREGRDLVVPSQRASSR